MINFEDLVIRKSSKEDFTEKGLFEIEEENMSSLDSYEGFDIKQSLSHLDYIFKEGYSYSVYHKENLIGFVKFLKVDKEPVVHIKNIQVKKEYQGKGIGKFILDFLEKETKRLNCDILELAVSLDNEKALSFYKKNGFSKSKLSAKEKSNVILEKNLKPINHLQ